MENNKSFKQYLQELGNPNQPQDPDNADLITKSPAELAKLRQMNSQQRSEVLRKQRANNINAITDPQIKALMNKKALLQNQIDHISMQIEQLTKQKAINK